MAIGEEIRRARRAMDLTQKDLATKVSETQGVKLSQREVSQLEKGAGNPTLKKLEAIVKVLGKEWVLK
ncbi:helix-turn-helix domain-containing protein [Joostella sp. CR20]|uniref:helix-turn-helix domain-containing protein n=1 Tax=Joostella sp. CR20 TaxID=2804312 RepID=UPI00313BF864